MRRFAVLTSLLVLGACGGDAPEAADGARPASGSDTRGVFYTLQQAGAVGQLGGKETPAGKGMTYLDISPDGTQLLASATGENALYLIDIKSGVVLDTIAVGASPKGVRFAPYDGLAFVANEGAGTLGVIVLRRGLMVQEVPVGAMPHNIVFDPTGQLMYVTVQGADEIAIIDLEMLNVVDRVPMPGQPHNLAVSADGTMLYVTLLGTKELVKLEIAGSVERGRAPLPEPHYGVALSPDASRAYVTGMAGTVVRVIDTATMRRVTDVEVGLAPHGVRTNTAGDEVYVSVASSDEIVVIDGGSNTVKRREKVGKTPFWIAVAK